MSLRPDRRLPHVTASGVSARFLDQRSARRATRSLQREHGVPTEAIGVSMAPGPDAAEVAGEGGYMGVTKGGAVIVNVSVADAEIAARIKQLLATAGGELTQDGFGSPLMGAYGPTTAHGRRGVIGGQPATSAMANQTFQDALGRGASAELTISEREREAAPTARRAR